LLSSDLTQPVGLGTRIAPTKSTLLGEANGGSLSGLSTSCRSSALIAPFAVMTYSPAEFVVPDNRCIISPQEKVEIRSSN